MSMARTVPGVTRGLYIVQQFCKLRVAYYTFSVSWRPHGATRRVSSLFLRTNQNSNINSYSTSAVAEQSFSLETEMDGFVGQFILTTLALVECCAYFCYRTVYYGRWHDTTSRPWRLAVAHIIMSHPTVLKSKITAGTTLVGEFVFGHYYSCATIKLLPDCSRMGNRTQIHLIPDKLFYGTACRANLTFHSHTIHMYPSPSRLLPFVFCCAMQRGYGMHQHTSPFPRGLTL
ncbi:hypothetical protein F5888DRAFT_968460 [Russula emetica]|nr:hypothetical protein F5888DRAFT_968460 [Russula emetica]